MRWQLLGCSGESSVSCTNTWYEMSIATRVYLLGDPEVFVLSLAIKTAHFLRPWTPQSRAAGRVRRKTKRLPGSVETRKPTQTDLENPPMFPLLCSARMLLHPGTPKRALNQYPCSEGIVLTPSNNAFPIPSSILGADDACFPAFSNPFRISSAVLKPPELPGSTVPGDQLPNSASSLSLAARSSLILSASLCKAARLSAFEWSLSPLALLECG